MGIPSRRACPAIAVLILAVVLVPFTMGCGGGGGGTPGGGSPAPTLTGVTPSTGFAPGGTTATLTGTGFAANGAGANGVTVGGTPATSVVTVDDGTITCAIPAGVVGMADVTVTNANGSATLAGAFTYYGFPPSFLAADTRLDTDAVDAGDSADPQICCDGSNVYVAWEDDRDGALDIYFNRSSDGGATWQAADTRLDTDAAGAANSSRAQICCEGSRVYVVWYDERNGAADIYLNRSSDGGATWQAADVRLDTDVAGAADSTDPRICCDGLYVYVTWMDGRNGLTDVYLNRSSNGGATWQAADTRLDTDGPGTSESLDPQICCEGARVYVTWSDDRDGLGDIYLNRSSDGGATWQVMDARLDTDAPGGAHSANPQICCDGIYVYVAWQDGRDIGVDIYFNTSRNDGATWQPADVRLNRDAPGMSDSYVPQICCDERRVHVTWVDNRDGNFDIYLNRSTDAGSTWQAIETRLDTDGLGASNSYSPQICSDGTNVFATWADDRGGSTDVYLNASRDGGATWQVLDTRLDTHAAGAAYSNDPQICCDGARAYVTWYDARDTKLSVYFTVSQP